MPTKLEEVFGVSSQAVLSYVVRSHVDDNFREALKSDKQVVVYGSSKQGKTSLVSKYLPYDKNIVVRLTPKTEIVDIYSSILRSLDVRLEIGNTETTAKEAGLSLGLKIKALVPIFGGSEAETATEVKYNRGKDVQYEEIPVNLALPQDVSELMSKTRSKKVVILENFHYLNEDRQRQFAFDLRTYQELGIRFIILGVWREKNRLAQFNGDLLDRIVEVPVEPWDKSDFKRVALRGQDYLNIEFSDNLIEACSNASFSSIGVFQELIKEVCALSGVTERQHTKLSINDLQVVDTAVHKKAEEYASRHQRALETIAAGSNTSSNSARDGRLPLYLPYYLVKVILSSGYDGLATGMMRSVIHEKIQAMHHRKQDVRASDMSNLLYNLAALQSSKNIVPPIIDYDKDIRRLQIVDSTFYFFLKNANLEEISNEIPDALEDIRDSL